MDLKAAVVLVCLCAALITSTKGNYSNKEYFAEVFFYLKKQKQNRFWLTFSLMHQNCGKKKTVIKKHRMCFCYKASTREFLAALHCAALCDELIYEQTVCLNLIFQPHLDCSWYPEMLHQNKNEHSCRAAEEGSQVGYAAQQRCL